jgi:hypothetical protein
MMRQITIIAVLVTVLGALTANAVAADAVADNSSTKSGAIPDQKAMRHALEQYLARQGEVCLGKFDWPIDVSQRDFQTNARDAIQMPVLEKLGLVTSTVAEEPRIVGDEGAKQTVPVKRYELTPVGRKSYLDKDVTTRGTGTPQIEHHKDLCAAKLTLDKMVRWEEADSNTSVRDGIREGTIAYTYHVTAVPWALSPEAQKVFPMVGRIIRGDGKLELEQRMQFGKEGWTARVGL